MANKIYFCSTYYQLFTLVALKTNIDIEHNVTLIILGSCKNGEKICQNIKKANVFNDVKFVSTPKSNNFNSLCKFIFGYNWCKIDESLLIDEIVSFNFQPEVHWQYAFHYRKNHDIEINRFEEGILSYSTPMPRRKIYTISYLIRKLLLKKNMMEICRNFYCFKPSLYGGKLKPKQIVINNYDYITKLMAEIFNIKISKYENKTIYLSSIYSIDGSNPINEKGVIDKLSNSVTSGLILKPHPRENIELYRDINCDLDTDYSIPVEISVITKSYNNCRLLTSLSGSLLNLASIYPKVKFYYLTNMIDYKNNQLAQYYGQEIIKVGKAFENIYFIDDLCKMEG